MSIMGISPNVGGMVYSSSGGDDFHQDGIIAYTKWHPNIWKGMRNQWLPSLG